MISERIQKLRGKMQISQAELANRLGVTRSSINAWEMGLSVPSTQFIVEMAKIFCVSTDYILGVNSEEMLSLRNLERNEIEIILKLVDYFNCKNETKDCEYIHNMT